MGQDCFKSDDKFETNNEFEAILNKRIKYWNKRCLLAEAFIEATPNGLEASEKQIKAYKDWDDFIHGRRE